MNASPRISGSPYPDGAATRSSGAQRASRSERIRGSARSRSGSSRAWSMTRPSPSRSRSRLLVPGSVPTTRSTGLPRLSAERAAQFQDLLGVEDLVVGGEEFLDSALVDLHLGAADA